jgi:thymidylate synthase ThyX
MVNRRSANEKTKMKIQYVSIKPTQKAEESGCYAFIPEMLASVGARYSRNNEGLDAIVDKLDPNNQEKSIDNIFKYTDFGHASIADMAPIALFIDDITLYAAYFLWTLSPTAGGQECSTRYIKMDSSNVASTDDLGIYDQYEQQYDLYVAKSFNYYEEALKLWTKIGEIYPELTKIPSHLLNSESDKDKKQVARMMRNFAFDRARVYLPVSTLTGVMMIQSARAWANISAHLQSHDLKELNLIGKEIEEKLKIGAPRLVRHCKPTDAIKSYYKREFELWKSDYALFNGTNLYAPPMTVNKSDLDFRTNRYSPFSSNLSRIPVKISWSDMSFGEIRDLNRHRTGTKFCPFIPKGFYGALEQIPDTDLEICNNLKNLHKGFESTTWFAQNLMKTTPDYVYFTSLGHQYLFEHTTTADKFLYEMELRTGVGAHYKYAEHCHHALELWYQKYPQTKGVIFEGSAEPE